MKANEHTETTSFMLGSAGHLKVEIRTRKAPDQWQAVWSSTLSNHNNKFIIQGSNRFEAWKQSIESQSKRGVGLIGVRLCAYSDDHFTPIILLWLSTETIGTLVAARMQIPCRIIREIPDAKQIKLGQDPDTEQGDIMSPAKRRKRKAKKPTTTEGTPTS